MKFFINAWYLVQGSITQVGFHILDETGYPYDTTGVLSAFLELKKSDGSTLSIPANNGFYIGMHPAITVWNFPFTIEDLDSLPIGKNDAFVKLVYSDSEKILSYHKSISVSPRPI